MYCLISLKKIFNSTYVGIFKCVNGFIFLNKVINGNFLGDFFKIFFLPLRFFKNNNLGVFCLILNLPIYTIFSNVYFSKNKSQLAMSAGTYCQLLEIKTNLNLTLIKLPSNLKKFIN